MPQANDHEHVSYLQEGAVKKPNQIVFGSLDELSTPSPRNNVAGDCDQAGAAEAHQLRSKVLHLSTSMQ